ncbi:MAG: class I tRNA ligase family protein [Bdellovibrionales bacterium]
MQVFQLDPTKLQAAYNILCQGLLPEPKASLYPPFGLTYCEIPPRGQTAPHDHYDGEAFLVLSGSGQMRINDERREVQTGDLIVIPNHSSHELRNSSESENLKFVSIYWDEPALSRRLRGDHLIYSAPPTPNGKLHVGHLSGPYLAADVLRRYLRLRGLNAVYCSGADENQTYVPAKARQLQKDPLAVANEFTEKILGILSGFQARPDYFQTPHTDETYREFVRDFFSRLVKNGALQRKDAQYPFCKECEVFVHESSVSGGCPHCGETTNGNGCEACGLYNDSRDLKSPRCNLCGADCILKSSERYVFSLAAMRARLEDVLRGKNLPLRLREYVTRLLDEGLADVTVTYPYPWGIPSPTHEGEVIYEWFEMAAAYVYQAAQAAPTKDYAHYWVDPNHKTALAFGFDNSFFYMALVPALLWAFDERIGYPDAFLINCFYLLDGKKFSTSRNHAVWGDEILQTEKSDVVRLYLAFTRPEEEESNFTRREFENFVAEVGVNRFDALLSRLARMEIDFSDGPSALNVKGRVCLERWDLLVREAELALDPQSFSLRRWADVVLRYLSVFDEAVGEAERSPVKSPRVLAAGLRGLAQILTPICPEYGERLFTAVNVEPKWTPHLDLPAGPLRPGELPTTYFHGGTKNESTAV